MNHIETLYKIGLYVRDHKEELLKDPDAFKNTLELLKKAKDKADDEYGEGFSVVDDPNQDTEEDDADKWLKAQKDSKSQPKADAQAPEAQKKFLSEWKPREDYSEKEKAAIKSHMDNGYTHREAERLAGAHKGPTDHKAAMKSGISPSMMSDKMMGSMKPLAKEWLENADRVEKLKADPSVNPMKHASGKLMQAHEQHTGDYSKAYNEFLTSDAVKNLKGKERHNAIQSWKGSWKKDNPAFAEGMADVSNTQKTFSEAKKAANETLQEKLSHIMTGGVSMPSEMSEQEAMQHLGGSKTEEGGYTGSIIKDPSANFAAKNPKLLSSLNQDQASRLKRIDSAAAAQGVVRRRKGDQ